ncbi:MAG: GAF domain-containing protein [Desulfobacterales bacterium]|nr:GAF domain-containing protein [Desulfobacterales bacterium]
MGSHNQISGVDRSILFDIDINHLTRHKRLNKLLGSVITEVQQYSEYHIGHIKRLSAIGLALSSEKDIRKLLELIVAEARDLSNADAGTLYTIDKKKQELCFEIMQNDTMKTRLGGTGGAKISLPNVPLYIDGDPNYGNVSSYAALTEEIVNIPDVYEADGFDFTGPRKYDAATGYRSKSMLVIPMKNHENTIIGILQLLNAQDPETGNIIPFSNEFVELIASLASQAAVALTNTQLIEELKALFYAFIKSIAMAIDEKSPYTGGHIKRVVYLSMMLAEKINETQTGPLASVSLNQEELEELRLAAWMHDVGKITTPEHVVDKSCKLETIFDRSKLIETRFQLFAKSIETDFLRRKIKILQEKTVDSFAIKELDREMKETLQLLERDLEFIKTCNSSGEFMSDEKISHLREIASKTCKLFGRQEPYLNEEEVENLSIRKGTLDAKERKIVENHATMTLKILKQLPFPRQLSHVPDYAGAHHEKLNGSVYPIGLTDKELPLQSRILAIADVFEALTARDRPYKKPMNLSQAITIMKFMKEDRHIDPDLYDLFVQSGLCYEYARQEMNPDQIDVALTGATDATGEDE